MDSPVPLILKQLPLTGGNSVYVNVKGVLAVEMTDDEKYCRVRMVDGTKYSVALRPLAAANLLTDTRP